jgi:hypothetical protein
MVSETKLDKEGPQRKRNARTWLIGSPEMVWGILMMPASS